MLLIQSPLNFHHHEIKPFLLLRMAVTMAVIYSKLSKMYANYSNYHGSCS